MAFIDLKDLATVTRDLSIVLGNFPIYIIAIDKDCVFKFWNKKCETTFGYSYIDVRDKKDFIGELIPENHIKNRTIKVLTSQKTLVRNFETQIQAANNQRIRISWDEIEMHSLSKPGLRWFAGTNITETYENWKLVKKNHKKINEIQSLAHIGSWDWDVSSNEVTWSDEMFKIFGLPDNVKGYTNKDIFRKVLLPSEYKHFKENVRKIFRKLENITFEYKILHPRRGVRTITARSDLIITNNKIVRIFGTNFDTTDIRQAETELKKIQKSLERAQNIAKIGSWEHSFIENKNYFSLEFSKLFDVKDQTELDKVAFNSILDESKQRFNHFYETVFVKKENSTCEFQIISNTNIIKVISASAEIEYNAIGDPETVSVIFQDITEIKTALLAEKTSASKVQNILHASPDAIIVSDMSENIVDWNKGTIELFGIEKHSLKKIKNSHFFTPDSYDKFTYDIANLVTQNTTLRNKNYTMCHNTGFKFPAEVSVGIINNENEEPEYIVSIIKDVTERLRYEKQLKKAIHEAKSADRLKSAFLANMSHEIRTPMNAIIGFSNILSEPNLLPEERTEYINYITSSSVSLMTLIDDIIDISKIESGEVNIKKNIINVTEILKEINASINEQKTTLDKANLPIILEIPKGEIMLETDEVRLKQVLINLLNNAIKFTTNGSVTYGFVQKEINYKPFLEFYVKDTGMGIESANLKKIFTRFTKISNTNSETLHRGTGLGLAISKKLIRLMGGTIWADSIYGEGSIFKFTIPITQTTYQNQLRQIENINSAKGAFNWKDKIILIAEDEFTNFQLLKATLKRANPIILWAKNGAEALEYCKVSSDIKLVLMDIQMPVMNGYEAFSEIRKLFPKLPIIAQTAFAMSGQKEKILSAGFDNYISKPINRDKLLTLINKYIFQDTV